MSSKLTCVALILCALLYCLIALLDLSAVLSAQVWQSCGGVGRNVAHCLANLIQDKERLPLLISVVGKDSMGAYLGNNCDEIGCELVFVMIVLLNCYLRNKVMPG